MASIELTVKNESLANCELPDGPMVCAPIKDPLAAEIRSAMAELRDPANGLDVHRVAAKTGVKPLHVKQILAAMRARVAASIAPVIEPEER